MKDKVIEVLKNIIDPELGIDVVTLGLIRDITFGEDIVPGDYEYVTVIMTLTSPMCPFADVIVSDVVDNVSLLEIGQCKVELTFDPPWEATEELRLTLGI